MSEREEFVQLADGGGVNLARLCRRFGISRKTGYQWLKRHRAGQAMTDRSRRPGHSPKRTVPAIERAVLAVRDAHRCWGGRKIRRRLLDLGHTAVPAASTITAILHRHGRIDPAESTRHTPWQRFEHARPNDLWQMDYKGHVGMANGRRCHPLTVLDDHSRYALAVVACGDERERTTREHLTAAFERYGLPRRLLSDNGPPWGVPDAGPRAINLTRLGVWLMRLEVQLVHGRPRHPQTQGKDERFHRTLKAELLSERSLTDATDAQRRFDRFRHVYNHQRPHEALDLQTPGRLYQPSVRSMPSRLPDIAYGEREVRRVQADGRFHFHGRAIRLSKALAGQPIALRPTLVDDRWQVVFCRQTVAILDERDGEGLCFAAGRSAPASEAEPSPKV